MQTLWQQNYDPAGNIWLSALVALIPIVFFFLALTKLRLKGYQAGTVTVLLALGVALLFYKMPVSAALASAVYGFFYGLWPIAWIIVAAVFLYQLSAAEREAFVKATRPVYDKWKNQIGADLVTAAEKAIAARKQ